MRGGSRCVWRGSEIANPVVILSLQKKGAFSDPYFAGNVGGGALKRFTVTFDYARKRIIFEPNAAFETPDVYDRAGMWLNRGSDSFEVVDVVAGGPAEVAGVKVGDRITAYSACARQLSLPIVRERFRTEAVGTTIKLAVQRDGKSRNLKLVLRDLVPGSPGA